MSPRLFLESRCPNCGRKYLRLAHAPEVCPYFGCPSTGITRPFKFDPNKDIDEGDGQTNGQRANAAEVGLHAFKRALGEAGRLDADTWQDLIADLYHWADRQGFDPVKEANTAVRRWEEER